MTVMLCITRCGGASAHLRGGEKGYSSKRRKGWPWELRRDNAIELNSAAVGEIFRNILRDTVIAMNDGEERHHKRRASR